MSHHPWLTKQEAGQRDAVWRLRELAATLKRPSLANMYDVLMRIQSSLDALHQDAERALAGVRSG